MDFSTLLSIAFLLICFLFIFLLIAISKINSLHKKVTDVSPKDLYPFMEELRELVIESERVADKLEDAIKIKEEMLEDISSLINDNLKRLESIPDAPEPTYTPSASYTSNATYNTQPIRPEPKQNSAGTMRGRISEMVQMGLPDSDIAAKLGISTTEVQIVKKMDIG